MLLLLLLFRSADSIFRLLEKTRVTLVLKRAVAFIQIGSELRLAGVVHSKMLCRVVEVMIVHCGLFGRRRVVIDRIYHHFGRFEVPKIKKRLTISDKLNN